MFLVELGWGLVFRDSSPGVFLKKKNKKKRKKKENANLRT